LREWAFIASGTNAKTELQRMKAVPTEKEMLWEEAHKHPRRRAMRPRLWRRPADYIGRSPARLPLVAEINRLANDGVGEPVLTNSSKPLAQLSITKRFILPQEVASLVTYLM